MDSESTLISQENSFNQLVKSIIIGSRGSDLALWQAYHVSALLKQQGIESFIKIIKTQGDKIQHLSLDKLEGKGFFTKELEEELLAGTIDLAVHSHKDLPTNSPPGLMIAAVSDRENPSDMILIRKSSVDEKKQWKLKENAVFGSSSARRKAQVLASRSDLILKDIRGNVPTRIAKLRNGEYDAIMLASAGVIRLNLDLSEFEKIELKPEIFIPSPAQGVLALQINEKNQNLFLALQTINNKKVQKEISVERKVLNLFEGGCHMPLGVYCKEVDHGYEVFISKADSANDVPIRQFQFIDSLDGAAEMIVNNYEKISTISSVLITRNESPTSFLSRIALSMNFTLSAIPFIKFDKIINNRESIIRSLELSNWIFFSSKNTIDYFIEYEIQIPSSIKIGCIGASTAFRIKELGFSVDFEGTGNDPQQAGIEFAKLCTDETVLFPIGKQSLRSIQKELKENQIIEIEIYDTVPNPVKLENMPDVFIFTSPSNVMAYLEKNDIESTQKVISIGKSTAKKLHENGIYEPIICRTTDDFGIAEAIFKCK